MLKACEIIKVDLNQVDPYKVSRIATVVKSGGVVVYPTDTIYGLGGSPFIPAAVEKIGRIKGRAAGKPMLLLIDDANRVDQIASEIPEKFCSLSKVFWPGPLTIILRAKETVPYVITGHTGTVGIRLPDSRFARELVAQCGFPLISTSANLSGEENILQSRRIIEQFQSQVDLIVDAGDLASGVASTIVSLVDDRLELVREGRIKFQEILQALTPQGD